MEGKFDITTFFRTVMPGYVFLLVIFTLKPQWFNSEITSNVAFLALLGLPIGYLAQELNRWFFYLRFFNLLDWESRFDKKDLIYIAENKKLRRAEDKRRNIDSFNREEIFHYSTLIDYLLFTAKEPELQELNEHLRFLYTRMHSYGATVVAIIAGIGFFIVYNPQCCTSSVSGTVLWRQNLRGVAFRRR